jgi:hypothetical protein
LHTEGGKAAADLENLLMAIVWIEILQQKCDHSALCGEYNRNCMIVNYFRLFLELDLVCKTGM